MSHYAECLLAARCIGGVNDPEHRLWDEGHDDCLDCGESCQCDLIERVLDNAVQRVGKWMPTKLRAVERGWYDDGQDLSDDYHAGWREAWDNAVKAARAALKGER